MNHLNFLPANLNVGRGYYIQHPGIITLSVATLAYGQWWPRVTERQSSVNNTINYVIKRRVEEFLSHKYLIVIIYCEMASVWGTNRCEEFAKLR